MDHAAGGILQEQVLDLIVRLLQPVGQLLDEADGDLDVAADHRLERLGIDDEELAVLGHHRPGRARLVVQDGHLAEELTSAERGQDLLGITNFLGDVHLAGLDDVHLLADVALLEEHVAALELLAESLEERVLARHVEFLSVRLSSGQFK